MIVGFPFMPTFFVMLTVLVATGKANIVAWLVAAVLWLIGEAIT